MTADKVKELREKIDLGIKTAAARAIEEHRLAGRSIVVWKDGKVVTVPAEEIPPIKPEYKLASARPA